MHDDANIFNFKADEPYYFDGAWIPVLFWKLFPRDLMGSFPQEWNVQSIEARDIAKLINRIYLQQAIICDNKLQLVFFAQMLFKFSAN